MATVTYEGIYRPEMACSDDFESDHWTHRVLVDPEGWLIATDNYILAAIPCEIEGELKEPVSVSNRFFALQDDAHDDSFTVEDGWATWGDSGVSIPTVKAHFQGHPWRELIPEPESIGAPTTDEYMLIQPELLTKLSTALFVKMPAVHWNKGRGPHIVMDGMGAWGLIMPYARSARPRPEVDKVLSLRQAKVAA